MTPEERANWIIDHTIADQTREAQAKLIAAEIRLAVKEATENLTWNLASCSTFALGYGLDERFNKSKARAAMFDVHNLALKYRPAKAEAYEHAARIAAEGCSCDCGINRVAAIRALAAEVGK